jgi:hypothetical protein
MEYKYLAQEVLKVRPDSQYVFAVGGIAYVASQTKTGRYAITEQRSNDSVLVIATNDTSQGFFANRNTDASVAWSLDCHTDCTPQNYFGRFLKLFGYGTPQNCPKCLYGTLAHTQEQKEEITKLPRYSKELELLVDALSAQIQA